MMGQNYGRFFGHDTLKTSFTIPANVENLELLYTSTGHGGWGGGDEFNPKLNQVFIDGKLIFSIVPWRADCGTYRMANPSSGNFQNGLSSSDLSRSNWCPATVTPPYYIPLKDLTPGEHYIEVVIDQGVPEGNSFSAWNVSGIITGTFK
ncbi:MAG: peptide-N-glycosidase F-related protein [Bacteroidales bacterium]|nr:peptide-N-glycosidase F-related protein [Bacteroidales bacterium]